MHSYLYGTLVVFSLIQLFSIIRLFQYGGILDLKGMKEGRNLIHYLSDNLLSSPIQNITFVKGKCPVEFEHVTLGQWPGLATGCYCKTGIKYKTIKCSEKDLDSGCHDIKPLSPHQYNFWKGKRMCINRMETGSFDKLQFECLTPEPCCKEGFRLCAEDLCVDNNKTCPITSVRVATEDDKKNGETVNFDNITYYALEREVNTARQIVSFEISRAPIPCLDPNVQDNGNTKLYPFLDPENIQESCGRWGFNTEYSKTVDSESESAQLKENEIYPNQRYYMPGYSAYLNQSKVYLSSRATVKIYTTGNCRFFEPSYLRDFERDFVGLHKTIVIVEIIHSLSLILVAIVIFVSVKKIHRWARMNRPDSPRIYVGSAALGLFLLLGITVIRYFICKSYVQDAIEANQTLQFFIGEKCIGDFRYTKALSQIQPGKLYERINSMNLVVFALSSFVGVVVLFLGVFTYWKKHGFPTWRKGTEEEKRPIISKKKAKDEEMRPVIVGTQSGGKDGERMGETEK